MVLNCFFRYFSLALLAWEQGNLPRAQSKSDRLNNPPLPFTYNHPQLTPTIPKSINQSSLASTIRCTSGHTAASPTSA